MRLSRRIGQPPQKGQDTNGQGWDTVQSCSSKLKNTRGTVVRVTTYLCFTEAKQRVDTYKEPVTRNTRGLRGKRSSRPDI